jgi:hypothetical protein
MKETGQDLVELRREVVETRNQVIRTDNQIKNIAADVRTYDKRFEALDRRARVVGLGSQILVAAVVAIAAYAVHSVRTALLKSDLAQQARALKDESTTLHAQADKARARADTIEQENNRRAVAEKTAVEILNRLDQRQQKEATDLLETLRYDDLTALERRLLNDTVGDLRRRAAQEAFRNGRNLLATDRGDQGMAELKRSLELDPDGHESMPARYLLATHLWDLKHFDEVEQMAREMMSKNQDKALLDDLRFLLATSLAEQSGKDSAKKEEAKKVLRDAIRAGGRYANQLRMVLAAIEQEAELPDLSGRGAKAAVRRPEGGAIPAPVTPTASTNAAPPPVAPSP